MSGIGKVILAVAAVVTLACCGLGSLAVLAASGGCATPAPTADAERWSGEQVANATTIVAVGARLKVAYFGWVIAVATAMQESRLYNLDHLGADNDHDSLGLFQQRPSQGWGTPEQVLDPVYAATAFYTKLLRVAGWQQMALTDAAQAVQVSAYPQAYAKHEPAARVLVDRVAARLGLPADCPDGAWVSPLPPGTYRLSSPFGPRWGRLHAGQDFAAAPGTPIRAASAGVVVAAECTSPFCDRPGAVDASGRPITPGCGLRLVVEHALRVASVYCHAATIGVQKGQIVAAGQVIGTVGSTGNSTGPHLHFEIHRPAPPVDASNATEPVAFLASVGVKV